MSDYELIEDGIVYGEKPEIPDNPETSVELSEDQEQEKKEVTVDAEEQSDESESAASEEEEEVAVRKKKSGVQRLKEKNERLAFENDELKQKLSSIDVKKAYVHDPEEPNENDFEDYKEYLKSLARYEGQKAFKQAREEDRISNENKNFEAKLRNTSEKHDDFIELLEDAKDTGLIVTSAMDSAFRDSDLGGEMFYSLVSNKDEWKRIVSLSPSRQLLELGKLESSLGNSQKQKQEPTKKPKPSPPAPVQPLAVRSSEKKVDHRLEVY